MGIKILCVDDDAGFLTAFRLQVRGVYEIFSAENLKEAEGILSKESVDLVLLDIDLGGESGIQGIWQVKRISPKVDVVMVSGHRDPKVVVEAMRAGAADYLAKPFAVDELTAVVERVTKNRQVVDRYDALIEAQNTGNNSREMICTSRKMFQLMSQAEQLKSHQANVLITGETGTGKELLARHIHRVEQNPQRPFIAINCAAIPENLIEAELFGAERGAYTGSMNRRIGRFELADGGDIFFDEIGSLKLDLQAKILRVLQEKEFTRVGGSMTIRANFRVISATNDDLDQMVTRGEFRMDLYHRLRVIQLTIPSLRERREDIPVLVSHFLQKHAQGRPVKHLSPQGLERLMAYHWPGNVRELENVVQSLLILSPSETIEPHHLPSWALNGIKGPNGVSPSRLPVPTSVDQTVGTLREYTLLAERRYIEHVLKSAGGDKSKAARILDVGRTTLYAKLKELGLM